MAEAPKIPRLIRERVRAQQAAVRSEAEHPDADLLTAFSENTLAREERSLVMDHLGSCEACRDAVMLSQNLPGENAQPARLPARPFLSWMTLRWASLAAVFAVAIGVVVIERSTRQGSILTPPTPASEVVAPTRAHDQERQMAVPKPAAEEKDAKLADARVRGKTADKPVAASSAPPPPYVARRENSVGRQFAGEAQSRADRGAARGSLPKEEYSSSSDAVAAKQQMIRNRGQQPVEITNNFDALGAGAGSGAHQPARAPAAGEYASSVPAVPATASSTTNGTVAPGTSGSAPAAQQGVVAKKSTDQLAAKATSQRTLQRTGSRDEATAAQTEARTSDDANFQAKDQLAGLTTENLAAAGPVTMRWRLRQGKLQHSADEGKTWQEINLEPGVNLHSFWIQGADVWAGGTGGSLYHVTSQGKNAVRIPLKISGGDVSQTVVTISFSDERNGIITLENGHILRTSDGGKTWERF